MKTKIPQLRFPEFKDSGDWEKIPFGQTCKFVRGPFGGALKKEIFVRNGYAVYEQSHVIYNEFTNFRYYISDEKFNELKRFSVTADDIIMSCSGTMGKFAIIPHSFTQGVINQALLKLTVKNGYDVKFIKFILELPVTQRNLLSQSAGGAIKNVVSVDQIKVMMLSVPVKREEQQKIADCLASLDQTIGAETGKLKAYQKYKKWLMQQLFPADGKTVPRLRFPEFRNAPEWEEKTLSEFAFLYKGKGVSKADIIPNGKIPCIRYGELYTAYNEIIDTVFSATNLPLSELFFSKKNDVLLPSSGETKEDISTASCVMLDNIALGGDLNVIRTEQDGRFISYYFNSAKKREIAKIAQGDTVVHLYSNQLKQLKISLPELSEQQKIADCLSSLDELIAAQTQKIERLKIFKKGLMQQLFPANDEANASAARI